MPVTTEEIKRHRELFGLEHPTHTTTERYRQHLAAGAIFWVDHHGFLRSTLSGEILAAGPEQIDALIAYLEKVKPRTVQSVPPEDVN